jgi:hypothetical protein
MNRDVASELNAVACHYGCEADVAAFITRARPWLERYTEVVLAEHSFEVVTGGVGSEAVNAILALASAASEGTRRIFSACSARFEDVMVGVKVGFATHTQPTLYVRSKCDLDAGLWFVALHSGPAVADQLRAILRENRTFYGFGFSDDEHGPVLKTYTLMPGERGRFVSWRVRAGELLRSHKSYEADLPLSQLAQNETWRQHIEFVSQRLGWQLANNVGRVEGGEAALKLYVERRGAIPTDVHAV